MTITTEIKGAFCDIRSHAFKVTNPFVVDLRHLSFKGDDLACVNLSNALLEEVNFFNAILGGAQLEGAKLKKASFERVSAEDVNFAKCDLTEAYFFKAFLRETNFTNANLAGANLECVNLYKCSLRNANLQGANLRLAEIQEADLTGANLEGADLTGADLCGTCLTGVKLKGAIGIGTRESEIKFAQDLLWILESGKGKLVMSLWHNCQTTHCLAGWRFPNEDQPGQKASLECPTLAQYFFVEEEEAMAALRRVAAGRESVFHN